MRVARDASLGELPEPRDGRPGVLERMLAGVASAFDGAAVRAMRFVVDRLLLASPEEAERLRRSAEPYLRGPIAADPRRFLADRAPPRIAPRAEARFQREIPGGAVFTCRVRTDVAPEDPILVEHWVHEPARPQATALLLHGFTMGWPRIDAPVMMASRWFALGLDVALLTLPYHGARKPAGSRFSGEAFARPDVGELNAAAARAVHEVRLALRWLRGADRGPVGLIGLSLGGYLAATVAGLEPELAFVVPMVPPVCFGDLAWRFFAPRAGDGGGATLGLEDLRLAYRGHSPLTYPLRVPRERALIVAGRGDRIVPASHPHALWEHWERPAIHWFPGSHLAPFGRASIAAAIEGHLRRIGVLR